MDLTVSWNELKLLQRDPLTVSPKVALPRDGAEEEWEDIRFLSDG